MDYHTLPTVARVPLNEKVYQVLMDSIMDGSLPPGSELREQHIAKQLKVSATPVREAFKRLASDGLIEIVPYCGAVVKELDIREIDEAYACREALEHLAVEQAIERISPRDVQRLRALLEEYAAAQGIEKISAASQRFDDTIYQLSGNQTLRNLLGNLKAVISRDRKYSASNEERRSSIYQEHSAIIDALERRDAQAAKQAVSHHIQNGLRYIRKKS